MDAEEESRSNMEEREGEVVQGQESVEQIEEQEQDQNHPSTTTLHTDENTVEPSGPTLEQPQSSTTTQPNSPSSSTHSSPTHARRTSSPSTSNQSQPQPQPQPHPTRSQPQSQHQRDTSATPQPRTAAPTTIKPVQMSAPQTTGLPRSSTMPPHHSHSQSLPPPLLAASSQSAATVTPLVSNAPSCDPSTSVAGSGTGSSSSSTSFWDLFSGSAPVGRGAKEILDWCPDLQQPAPALLLQSDWMRAYETIMEHDKMYEHDQSARILRMGMVDEYGDYYATSGATDAGGFVASSDPTLTGATGSRRKESKHLPRAREVARETLTAVFNAMRSTAQQRSRQAAAHHDASSTLQPSQTQSAARSTSTASIAAAATANANPSTASSSPSHTRSATTTGMTMPRQQQQQQHQYQSHPSRTVHVTGAHSTQPGDIAWWSSTAISLSDGI